MPTRLIELADGTLVEIEASIDHSEEISGGVAQRVKATLDQIEPTMLRVCQPLIAFCRELDQSEGIESAEIELGFGFEGEGNLYVAKAKSSANIVLKITPKLSGSAAADTS